MRIPVQAGMTLEDLAPYLVPVEQFGEEKRRKGCWDDWDEAAHTRRWLEKVLASMADGGGDALDIWVLEENGEMAGSAFLLADSPGLAETLRKDGVSPVDERGAQLTCFHIREEYRGKGLGERWMIEELFPALREQGIRTLYIRSSHHKALPLYARLGKQVGKYCSVSDHGMYRRAGFVYAISLLEDTAIEAKTRVREMEELFDRLRLRWENREEWNRPDTEEMLQKLIRYSESGQWLADFERDEQGCFPPDLKRGILSEDALYNFLCDVDRQS